jgi:murein DD-endopeptidase MepM/ murein hydrolase activator NlpD
LSDVLARLDRWNSIKAVTVALPLAEPLHDEWEMNSPFGARSDPLNETAGMHEGLDMGAPMGTPVYATGEGHVKMAGPYDRYGLTVDVDHGNGFVTRYAHLSQIKVHPGQKVTRETVIGLLGNTGRTTGAHLHYEVRIEDVPRNPITYITAGRDASKAR